MEKVNVKLMSLQIQNIKNISNGFIEFDKLSKNENKVQGNHITGVYGQNGSGKTAVVDAMYILQLLLKGRELPGSTYKYIKYGEKTAELKYRFFIENGNEIYDIEYSVCLKLIDEKRIILEREKLYGALLEDGEWSNHKTIIEYNSEDKEGLFKPNYRNHILINDVNSYIEAKVAQQFTQGYDEEKKISSVCSLLFSARMRSVFEKMESFHDISCLVNILHSYADEELIVIQNECFGIIDANISSIIFNVNMKDEIGHTYGLLPINVDKKTILSKSMFERFSKVVEHTSNVINAIVPEVTLEIGSIEEKYTEDGVGGVSFELITKRGNSIVPFECESAGIKKLISIATSLIACYNRSSVCLVIDEFDSGIFEYLLGQLIETMQEYAEGQLIFTSHNLRALEVLDNESLIFTTTDENDRYSTLKYIKNTQNKRLSYLRTIYLGGQDLEFYKKTSQSKIKRALRKSGR